MGLQQIRRAAAAGLVVLGVGAALLPAAAALEVPELPADMAAAEACRAVFDGGVLGGFLTVHKAAPGEPISVPVRWDENGFSGDQVELVGCVALEDEPVERLATRVRGVDNDGEHRVSFVAPSDAKKGAKLCQRTAVLGTVDGAPQMVKNRAVCYQLTSAAGEPQEHAAGPSEAKPTKVVAAPAPGTEAAQAKEQVAGKTEIRSAASAGMEETGAGDAAAEVPDALPRTGTAERILFLAAGVLLCLGGLGTLFGARRRTA